MLKLSEISNNSTAIIKKNLPSNELLSILKIVILQSLGLSLKVKRLSLTLIFLLLVIANFELFKFLDHLRSHFSILRISLYVFHYID